MSQSADPHANLEEHTEFSRHASRLRRQGDALELDGRYDDALRFWTQVLADEPDHPHAQAGAAIAHIRLGRFNDAFPLIQGVLAADTVHPSSLARLGTALHEARRHAEAIDVFQRMTHLMPSDAACWNRLGAAQLDAGLHPDAILSFRHASLLQPDEAAPHINIAAALYGLDRLAEAATAVRRALAIEPDSTLARLNLGFIMLSMGRFDEGWHYYGSRFAAEDPGSQPWTGQPLAGRSIVVLGEQANGDYIQFARYVLGLADLGARVTLRAPRRLHRLLSTLPCDVSLVDVGAGARGYDFQCAMMDLAHHLRPLGWDLASRAPYLSADPERVARWRDRLGTEGYRIGVAWEGSRNQGSNDRRSLPLAALWPLTTVPGVRLISLQVGSGLDQIPRLPPGMRVETLGGDYDAGEDAFLDAAAVMRCCDLVVTLDSALAHLAGATGCRAWIALPDPAEWRWRFAGAESFWYPSIRLFHQHRAGDWDGVFTRMAEALRRELSAVDSGARPLSRPVPLVPASCGEVLDKITILEIKHRRLSSPQAVADVGRELDSLRDAARTFLAADASVEAEVARLRAVNERLWDLEDALRACEAEGRFDEGFVALARGVYVANDERAALKRAINAALNSGLVEHKSYSGLDQGAAPDPRRPPGPPEPAE